MSLSSASSFERLDSAASGEQEEKFDTSFRSFSVCSEGQEEDVRCASTSSEESDDGEEAMREELEMLRTQCGQQRLRIALLEREREEQKNTANPDETAFRAAIAGKWKFSSSIDLQRFLDKRGEVSTDFEDVLFHVAEQNIEFHGEFVELFETVGKMRFNYVSPLLGRSASTEHGASVTYICGDVLKTVSVRGEDDDDEEEDVEERFVKDGKLHVVFRKHGESCTRIYTRCVDAVADINGLWRQVNQPNHSLSLEIRDGRFYRKIRNAEKPDEDVSDEYEIGQTTNKWTTSVEGNAVVQRMLSADGDVTIARKRFVEDGMLICIEEAADGKIGKWTFERVGPALAD